MLDLTKRYQTKDGKTVKNLRTTRNGGDYSILGEIVYPELQGFTTADHSWQSNGKWLTSQPSYNDLVEVYEQTDHDKPMPNWLVITLGMACFAIFTTIAAIAYS